MGKEREAQIDRVNEQVKDLYGPLLSCVTASKSAFDAMIGQHSPDGTKAGFVRAIRDNPDSGEAVAYRYFHSTAYVHCKDVHVNRVSFSIITAVLLHHKCTETSITRRCHATAQFAQSISFHRLCGTSYHCLHHHGAL